MQPQIYLDSNATTFLDPRVLEVMMKASESLFGNPSSAHSIGQKVRQQLNQARRQIAQYLGVRPQELLFNSCGTEGVNTVLRGMSRRSPKGHIVTSTAEHACVYATVKELEAAGHPVTYLSPGLWGAVSPEAVQAALRPDTALIALMAVNNETGVKTDMEGIAGIAHEARVPLFVDGVALLGKESFAIPAGVSAMAFSGHKLHAPKGVGLLVLRASWKIPPLLTGGGQEYGKRGGTENVAGILALAEAIRLLHTELSTATQRMRLLRDKLENGLGRIEDTQVNGKGPRVGNTLNISFAHIEGESLLIALDQAGVCVSHGSACSTGALEPSRILLGMGISEDRARSAMRFSLSRFTTEEEIDRAIQIVTKQVYEMRKNQKGER